MSIPKYTVWQKKSIDYIVKSIFPNSSRAFLADEAGLGKTVTAAGVMDRLYEKYKDSVDYFYVLYVAPSTFISNNACEKLKGKSKYEKIIFIKEMRLTDFFSLNKDKLSFIKCSIEKEAYDKGCKIILLSLSAAVNVCDALAKDECEKLIEIYNHPDNIPGITDKIKENLKEGIDKYKAASGERKEDKVYEKKYSYKFPSDTHVKAKLTRYYAEYKVLCEIKPKLVIWDEFHRYMNLFLKSNNNKIIQKVSNSIITYEENSYSQKEYEMKSLFLSATPYQSNVSGINKKLLEDDSSVVKGEILPSFDEFIFLCSSGKHKSFNVGILNKLVDEYKNCWNSFEKGPSNDKWEKIKYKKTELEREYKKIFIRHERTSLAGKMEKYNSIFDPYEADGDAWSEIYNSEKTELNQEYKEVFINQWKNSNYLNANHNLDARKWSCQMPYLMSFSKGYTEKGQVLCGEGIKGIDGLYLSKDECEYSKQISNLPNSNLQIHEIIKSSANEKMSQLLWIPPAVRYYNPGEDSIFWKYRYHSKLLIFAEQTCFQRGLPYLLREYVDFQTQIDIFGNMGSFELNYSDNNNKKNLDELVCLGNRIFSKLEKTEQLTDLIKKYQEESYSEKDIMAALGAPAICAKRLDFKPEEVKEVEDTFNAYFRQSSVKCILQKWKEENCPNLSYEETILRYCCEGNLFSVLEEWLMGLDSKKEKFLQQLSNMLCEERIEAFVNSDGKTNAIPNKDTMCKTVKFAVRLTTDKDDNGNSGTKKKVRDTDFREQISQAFSSPFWPMVLVTGRGAQESMDFHPYCNRIMHYTIPKGAVSIEQREGRINRYRSLLIKRRAAERWEANQGNILKSIGDIFVDLEKEKNSNPLYPNWYLPGEKTEHYFEKIVAFWPYTDEANEWSDMKIMLENYRSVFGTADNYEHLAEIAIREGKDLKDAMLDLSAP